VGSNDLKHARGNLQRAFRFRAAPGGTDELVALD
jgi:hypothetical protein